MTSKYYMRTIKADEIKREKVKYGAQALSSLSLFEYIIIPIVTSPGSKMVVASSCGTCTTRSVSIISPQK